MSGKIQKNQKSSAIPLRNALFDQILLMVIIASLTVLPFIFDSFTVPKLFVLSFGLLVISIRLIFGSKAIPLSEFPLVLKILVFLYVSFLSLSWAKSGVPFERGAIGQFGRGNGFFYYLFAISIFFLVAISFKKSSFERFHQLLSYFSWFLGTYAILQHLGIDIAKLDTRALSPVVLTFGNSNFAGGMLSILFAYHVTHLVITKKYSPQAFGLLFLLTVSTILPKAIQGYLIIAFALFFAVSIYISQRFKSKFISYALFTTWIIGIILITLGVAGKSLLASIFDRNSFQIRIEYWKITLDIIRDNLIFGVGPDRLYDVSSNYMSPGSLDLITTTRLDNAHNWYLQLGASFGLPAMISLIAIFLVVVISGVKLLRSEEPINRFVVPPFVAFIAVLIDGLVSLEQPGIGIWLYFFAGMVTGLGLEARGSDSKQSKVAVRNGIGMKLSIMKISLLVCIAASVFSTILLFNRIIQDGILRSNIQTAVLGKSSISTNENIAASSKKLRAEPEYAAISLKALAQAGDGQKLDAVSKSFYEYYPNSIQATLIRADVLRALGRDKESCPLRTDIISNIPWDSGQLDAYVICLSQGLKDSNYLNILKTAVTYLPDLIPVEIPTDTNEFAATKTELVKFAIRSRINYYLGNIEVANSQKAHAQKLINRLTFLGTLDFNKDQVFPYKESKELLDF
jgi:O-antigen ligase